jgi:octaprenyl-diphosphate synthase
LLDGTITLPLIEARGRDPELRVLEVRSIRSEQEAASVCDRIAATGALEAAKERALALVGDAKASLPLQGRQRVALELVADGVVERYA